MNSVYHVKFVGIGDGSHFESLGKAPEALLKFLNLNKISLFKALLVCFNICLFFVQTNG